MQRVTRHNIVVGKGAAILQLPPGKNEALLIMGKALLVLNLDLHRVDGIRRSHIECDGLACHVLDRNLHARILLTNLMLQGLLPSIRRVVIIGICVMYNLINSRSKYPDFYLRFHRNPRESLECSESSCIGAKQDDISQ